MVRKRRASGFTLTEVMITVAILGVVFSIGPSILTNVTRFTRLSQARIDTQRAARTSLSEMNKTLRQASAATLNVSQETGQPPYSSLSFTTVDGRAMKYYQQNTNLFMVNNGSTRTLSSDLRYIAFSYPRTDDPNIISVSVTFEKQTYQRNAKALQMAIEKVRIMND
jgi:prepilin-type N-terminal cleavage/methylation domain-containing protein